MLGVPFNFLIRYVLKKELLLDPSIDIVGQSLLNFFIERRSRNIKNEIKNIGFLGKNLMNKEAVTIYPEGTRFSFKKKVFILNKFKSNYDYNFYKYCKLLKKTLPPRANGAIELLLNNKNEADVIFCAHKGFELFNNLFKHKVMNKSIYVNFKRISFNRIPKNKKKIKKWFLNEWIILNKKSNI
jgi:1-acyl-sn-glycerol-3-phosphate acyltransferase